VREEYASDPRVRYVRNEQRVGLVNAWRRVFGLARELHPALAYYAWASDHDLWEPEWLPALEAELDSHPEAVLAYPLSDRIDAAGAAVRSPWQFDTAGDRSRASRFSRSVRRMVAGDMVYGLARADALVRCGGLRRVLLPDRLLVAELALQGELRQVPRVLWHRRHVPRPGHEPSRQRKNYGAGRPAWTALPWSLQHAGAIVWNVGVRGGGRPRVGRGAGVAAGAAYAVLSPGFRAGRWVYKRLPRPEGR
jgi:Glycosyl transferase family 2